MLNPPKRSIAYLNLAGLCKAPTLIRLNARGERLVNALRSVPD